MMTKAAPFAALAVAAAIIFFYMRPAYMTSIAALDNQISVDNQALAAADRFRSREADLTSQRNAIPADSLDRIEAYVPDNVDTVRLVIDLNALASRTGVTLSQFAVDNTNPNVDPATGLTSSSLTDSVDLSFTATGTYSSFRAFLSGVETSLRPYDAVDIAVKDSATGVYTYTLTLRTYSLQ